jgi:SAM-dependent methyltransferase
MAEIDPALIREAVRKKYGEVARSAEGKFAYPTGRQGALVLGYDPAIVRRLPDDVLASFCGVGNPLALGPIEAGESVLDVGCGAGFDMIVASYLVGGAGKICGVDMTPEMAERARANLERAGVMSAEVQVGGAESVPYRDATFDVVISNGVINLSPAKEEVFREMYRVLRPGGRLQFADIVVNQSLPPEVASSLEAWSQ